MIRWLKDKGLYKFIWQLICSSVCLVGAIDLTKHSLIVLYAFFAGWGFGTFLIEWKFHLESKLEYMKRELDDKKQALIILEEARGILEEARANHKASRPN